MNGLSKVPAGTAYLEVIIGPMFASKSTTLINTFRKYKCIGKSCMVITHVSDERYLVNAVATHDLVTLAAKPVANLTGAVDSAEYVASIAILVEEAQFFPDLLEFVDRALSDGKHIYVYGLSGDYLQRPFGKILELVPKADRIVHLTAFCKICADGTPAPFTKRIVNNSDDILIGKDDAYMPTCRNHSAYPPRTTGLNDSGRL